MKVVAFVQARMGSTRLPGKALLPIDDRPLVEWVLRRVGAARSLANVVMATSTEARDDVLARKASDLGFEVHRGSESDVLGRFVEAAARHPADHYVRVCADNPLVCFDEIDRLVRWHARSGLEYSFNHVPKPGLRVVDGFGAEIVTAAALFRLGAEADTPPQREHVTKRVWDVPGAFTMGYPDDTPAILLHPELKFDVDDLPALEGIRRFVRDAGIDIATPGAVIAERALRAGRGRHEEKGATP